MPTSLDSALIAFDLGVNNPLPLIGVDEVGRGSWVGPVVAAAVHIPPKLLQHPPDWMRQLNDSKKLKPAVRTYLAGQLQQHVHFALGYASIDDIETMNLHHASLWASQNAVKALLEQLAWPNAFILMDGCYHLPAYAHQQAIIKGDGQSAHIAAASIIAKVHRDEMLNDLDQHYPQYQWASNKGYGTKAHVSALATHGPCDHHRPRFLTKWRLGAENAQA
jgi:ribonuclease HII